MIAIAPTNSLFAAANASAVIESAVITITSPWNVDDSQRRLLLMTTAYSSFFRIRRRQTNDQNKKRKRTNILVEYKRKDSDWGIGRLSIFSRLFKLKDRGSLGRIRRFINSKRSRLICDISALPMARIKVDPTTTTTGPMIASVTSVNVNPVLLRIHILRSRRMQSELL